VDKRYQQNSTIHILYEIYCSRELASFQKKMLMYYVCPKSERGSRKMCAHVISLDMQESNFFVNLRLDRKVNSLDMQIDKYS
jgi:hypothetical protein